MFNFKQNEMKKYFCNFLIVLFSALSLCSCTNKSVPRCFIGKWDMVNDKTSSVQKVIEIKEGNIFVETWTIYDEDGEQIGQIEIQGKCKYSPTEGGYDSHALSLVYDLESLSDPDGILEEADMGNYFEKENENYESAKRAGQVYGYQDARVIESKLYFSEGYWTQIDEFLEELRKDTI